MLFALLAVLFFEILIVEHICDGIQLCFDLSFECEFNPDLLSNHVRVECGVLNIDILCPNPPDNLSALIARLVWVIPEVTVEEVPYRVRQNILVLFHWVERIASQAMLQLWGILF